MTEQMNLSNILKELGADSLQKLFQFIQRKYPNQGTMDNNVITFKTLSKLNPQIYKIHFDDGDFVMLDPQGKLIYFTGNMGNMLNKLRKLGDSVNELWVHGDAKEIPNIEYYQQLLNQSRLNPKTRNLVQGIINNVKAKNNLASPKQLVIFTKLKSGQLNEIKVRPSGQNLEAIKHRFKDKIEIIADKDKVGFNFRLKNKGGHTSYIMDKGFLDDWGESYTFFNGHTGETTHPKDFNDLVRQIDQLCKDYAIFEVDDLLTEDRIDFLKNQTVGKILSPDEFNQVVDIDPTSNKKYTQWLINVYNKDFKQNHKSFKDFTSYKSNIINKIDFFEKNKSLFQNKDINQYSLNSLNQNIDSVKKELNIDSDGSFEALDPNDINKLKKVGIKYLGEINGYQVIKIPKGNDSPQTHRVYADVVCQGKTHICTASNIRRFEYYLQNDNLFVILNPKDELSPYHVSFFTNQISDKNDDKTNNKEILDIAKKLQGGTLKEIRVKPKEDMQSLIKALKDKINVIRIEKNEDENYVITFTIKHSQIKHGLVHFKNNSEGRKNWEMFNANRGWVTKDSMSDMISYIKKMNF
jgi:hypothetical protein